VTTEQKPEAGEVISHYQAHGALTEIGGNGPPYALLRNYIHQQECTAASLAAAEAEYTKAERLWKAATVELEAAKSDAERGWNEVHGLQAELGQLNQQLAPERAGREHLEQAAELLRELWTLQEDSDEEPDFSGMARVARKHKAWIDADPCGHLIRDGQTTMGACQRERGHDGEHQRKQPAPPSEGPASPVAEGERVELNEWREWGMKLCPPPITCDADMREHIGNKAESTGWFEQQHARSQKKLFAAREGWDKVLARLRAQAAEREALVGLVGWIKANGRIENHGHRCPETACAECRVLNSAIDALRSQPTPTGSIRLPYVRGVNCAISSAPSDSGTQSELADSVVTNDVAPVVENTGHLSSPVAPAAEGEKEAWWACQRCPGKRWCLRSSFVCRQCLGMHPRTAPLALPPPASPPAQPKCAYVACPNTPLPGSRRCYDHQPQRCQEPASDAGGEKLPPFVGKVAAAAFARAGQWPEGVLNPPQPPPSGQGPTEALRAELIAALETSGNEPMKWLARELKGLGK